MGTLCHIIISALLGFSGGVMYAKNKPTPWKDLGGDLAKSAKYVKTKMKKHTAAQKDGTKKPATAAT